jgi:hypothetical protein
MGSQNAISQVREVADGIRAGLAHYAAARKSGPVEYVIRDAGAFLPALDALLTASAVAGARDLELAP